ncbi:GIY-YIG nuclease family protein [Candidatus Daviesbacteria bacterium]|nr:GIY-YIG nuclease family protein [Candidatus Daviesbacteria bacterium]
MYYVYILLSKKDKKHYTGITNDVDRRLRQHTIGYSSTRSTKNRRPSDLVFDQECTDRKEARELEKLLKSGQGRELREELLEYMNGPVAQR